MAATAIRTTSDEQPREQDPYFVSTAQSPEEQQYVLTLETDKRLHERVTALRDKYFPRSRNKLSAHLTLFHALPGSVLDSDIVPVIQNLADRTSTFDIRASRPFRLSKGIGISVPKHQGSDQARAIHNTLQSQWRKAEFLSPQDAGGIRVHWTIMNKVTDEAHIQKSLDEVASSWDCPRGSVIGLTLWRYEPSGHWSSPRFFEFRAPSEVKHTKP